MRSYWPATSGPTPRQDQQPDTDSHDRVGAQLLLRVRTSIDARFPTRPTTPNAAIADRRRLEQPSDTPDDQDRGRDRQVLQDEADEGPRTELYRSRGPLRRRLTRPGPRSNEDFYTEVVLDRPALARRGQRSVPVTAVDSWKHHRLKQLRGHAGSPFLDLLVRPGESAARPSPRLASPLEKRLPSMIIFCYTGISEVGQPRPVVGMATPPLARTTGPSPIRWRAFLRSGSADPARAGPGQPPGPFRMSISRSTT